MIGVLLGVLFGLMILSFPLMFALIGAPVAVLSAYFPTLNQGLIVQNFLAGIQSFVILSIPMFMLAGNIMCKGEMADRLIGFVRACLGHVPGGLAVTMGGACTIFGAVSGSAIATTVAIGKPMWKPMKKLGYDTPHLLASIVGNANIALLIPPSVCMIMYCVMANVSVADVFVAGVMPGLLMFVTFAIYEVIYAKRHNYIIKLPKSTIKEKMIAFKRASLSLGFPILILGGIYTGIFSPTEAAAVGVLYAIVLECLIYRSIKIKDLWGIAFDTAKVSSATMILTAGGKAFSWAISYAKIPQIITTALLGETPSAFKIMLAISIVFLVACCFIDSFPVIVIVIPIFAPIAMAAGMDMVHLGVVVTMQSAVGCITPPFGCTLFTASAAFNEKFTTVCKGLPVYLILTLLVTFIVTAFPIISMWPLYLIK